MSTTSALAEFSVRNRILEIELARGELDTPASLPAIHMACTGGLSTLERALGAVGSAGLARQQWHSYRGSPSRAQVMTHLPSIQSRKNTACWGRSA